MYVQEERGEDLGPCLEYVLHQDILNILVTLCQVTHLQILNV
jgi:hypothetical protein